jgi:hypothetical protein
MQYGGDMKKGGGRQKGSGFERTIAKAVLNRFAQYGITKSDCYRTPLSGGHLAARGNDPGDLVISKKLREFFPFCVECKFYKVVRLEYFWVPMKKHKKSWHITPWLDQTMKAVENSDNKNLHPLLIFKANKQRVFCCVPEAFPLIATKAITSLRFRYKGQWWRLCLFDTFLRIVSEFAAQGFGGKVDKVETKKKKKKRTK